MTCRRLPRQAVQSCIVFVTCVYGLFPPFATAQPPTVDVSFEEKLLATVPEDVELREFLFSPDGRDAAYVGQRGGRRHVVRRGVQGERFYDARDLTLSSDGKKVAYAAQTVKSAEDGKWFAIVDGARGPEFDVVHWFEFSPDGCRLAYAAGMGSKQFVMLDGRKGEEFSGIGSLAFSPDGKECVYEATGDSGACVVEHGIKRPGCLLPDPNGGWLRILWGISAAGALDGGLNDGEELLFIQDPILGSRSKRVICKTNRTGGKFIEVGGVKGPKCERDIRDNVVFSPDGKRVAYPVKIGEKWHVVSDDVLGDAFDWVEWLRFSPDGRQLWYGVWKGGNRLAVVNGLQWKAYDDVGFPTFSPDGKHAAYTAREGRRDFVVVDGIEKEVCSFCVCEVVFSPDSRRLIWVDHKDEKEYVVVDGVKGEMFDDIRSLSFSPDSTRLAFGARKGRELWWKVMELK